MDNNFSAQVKEIISFSREEALRLGNDFIGTEHLLLGMIREGENTAIKILKQLNVDLYELRKEVELAVKDKANKTIANINSLPLTRQAEKVIRITVLEAKALKSPLVETEHLMLSILKNKENIATQILNQFDVDYDIFKNDLDVVKSEPRSEYAEENDDDFEDEDIEGEIKPGMVPGQAKYFVADTKTTSNSHTHISLFPQPEQNKLWMEQVELYNEALNNAALKTGKSTSEFWTAIEAAQLAFKSDKE